LYLLGFIPLTSASQILHLPEQKAPLQTTTYSKHQDEAFSFVSNQAAIALFAKPSLGIYGEKRFMLNELNFFAASAVLPTSSGNFGFVTRRFGSANYNETEAGLAYGHKLGDRAAIGAQFNYHSFKAAGYGNASALSVDAGAIFQFSNELRGGFHVHKPAETIKEKNGEIKLSSVYELGLGYDASDQLFLTAIASKVEDMNVQVNAALQYFFTKTLLCKAGISSGSSSFYIGAGVRLKQFRLDAITSFHSQLGITPGIMLLFHLPDQ
jgi:hypothetical protein